MGSGTSGLYGKTSAKSAFVAGDASFMSKNDQFVHFISRRKDVDPNGIFDLIAHGSSHGIEVTHNGSKITIDSRTAAKLIKKLPGYNGQAIRLLSCSTGASAEGFAQNLANKLNVKVIAPTDVLWVNPNGHHFVAARGANGKPNLNKRGKFVEYTPGRKRR